MLLQANTSLSQLLYFFSLCLLFGSSIVFLLVEVFALEQACTHVTRDDDVNFDRADTLLTAIVLLMTQTRTPGHLNIESNGGSAIDWTDEAGKEQQERKQVLWEQGLYTRLQEKGRVTFRKQTHGQCCMTCTFYSPLTALGLAG